MTETDKWDKTAEEAKVLVRETRKRIKELSGSPRDMIFRGHGISAEFAGKMNVLMFKAMAETYTEGWQEEKPVLGDDIRHRFEENARDELLRGLDYAEEKLAAVGREPEDNKWFLFWQAFNDFYGYLKEFDRAAGLLDVLLPKTDREAQNYLWSRGMSGYLAVMESQHVNNIEKGYSAMR